jgi:hypothetical protein
MKAYNGCEVVSYVQFTTALFMHGSSSFATALGHWYRPKRQRSCGASAARKALQTDGGDQVMVVRVVAAAQAEAAGAVAVRELRTFRASSLAVEVS